jgi:hypothetical protein
MANILVWADGTADSEAYYSERHERWVFVDFLNYGNTQILDGPWVEVTLDQTADLDQASEDGFDLADRGLNQASVACDLEGRGLWVVEGGDLPPLLLTYGRVLTVTRVGQDDGRVLAGDEAEAWVEEFRRDMRNAPDVYGKPGV